MGSGVLILVFLAGLFLLLGSAGVALLFLLIRQTRMEEQLRRLQERVDRLEPPAPPTPPPSPDAADGSPEQPSAPVPEVSLGSSAPPPRDTTPEPPPRRRHPSRASGRSRHWRLLERQLLENWTGWLGVLALVSGLAFLTVSVAIRLEPFQRFSLLLVISGAMALPRLLLPPAHRLRPLSRWLSSGAAALVMFGCAGASALPGLGLQWISDPFRSLALLTAAVALNLAVAGSAASPWLAGGHVVISLLPLPLAAPSAEASVLAAVIAALGLGGRAGRSAPARFVVTVAFLLLQLWIAQRSGVAAPAWTTSAVVGFVLARGRRRAPPEPALWDVAGAACAWAGLMVVWIACPVASVLRALAFAVAAVAATALWLDRRRRGNADRLARIHWLAALLLSMAAPLALRAEISSAGVLPLTLVLIGVVFLQDAIRDRDALRAGVAGVSLLLMDGALLLVLVARHGEVALAMPLFVLAAALLQQRLLEPMRCATAVRLIPGAQAVAAALLRPAALTAAMEPGGARTWALLAALAPALGLRRWPRRQERFHEAPLAVGTTVGVVQLLATAGQTLSLGLIGERLLPVFLLGGVMAISSAGLSASLRGGRTAGLLLCGLTLFRAVVLGQDALPVGLLWTAPLGWILLAGLGVALACRWAQAGRRGETTVVLAMAYGALALFVLERLFAGGAAGDGRLQLGVDGTAVAALAAWRLLGGRVPLAGRPLWESPRRYAGELALVAAVVSLLRWLPDWGAAMGLSGLAVLLWQPQLAGSWPRARGHGLIAFWAGLLALVGISTAANLPMALAVGSLVVACTRFPFTAAAHPEPEGGEAPPTGTRWLRDLASRVGRHPHRWMAAPLSLGVTLLMARHSTAIWLTLTWSIEALILFGLGVGFRDRPLRIGALALMGLCLLRLVSVDMRQADLVVRGLVFTGVGLVLVVMNGLTSRAGKS